jgi:glycosyltransferase involved in cell wall biosynthesis
VNERTRKLLQVITDLYVGGAETMLTRVATTKPGLADDTMVISLVRDGFYAGRLRAAGIAVVELNFRNPFAAVIGLFQIAKVIREYQPDIIQSWMYHADLAAAFALAISGRRKRTRLVWGIRCSDLDLARYGIVLRLVIRLCAVFSRLPDLVIANSHAGMKWHRSIGFHPRASEIVYNGIEEELYKPDAAARFALRAELGIPTDAILLIHVARRDPMKDHESFLRAMQELPHLRAIMVGAGTDSLPCPPGTLGLGQRADVPRLLAAADILVCSSAFGEGFSNSIAEGMAAGLPVVATDVGDNSLVVGEAGTIVPPRDHRALAAGIRALASLSSEERTRLGTSARARAVAQFTLKQSLASFAAAYTRLA